MHIPMKYRATRGDAPTPPEHVTVKQSIETFRKMGEPWGPIEFEPEECGVEW